MAVAWADYDNDGHLDLVITAYGQNVLYHNNGDGTFTDRSDASGDRRTGGVLGRRGVGRLRPRRTARPVRDGLRAVHSQSTATGANGRYDVENPSSINPLAFPPERNLLFHNNGDGTFTEQAAAAGVANAAGRGLAAAWVDLDEDGWPDLYVANDVSAERPLPESGQREVPGHRRGRPRLRLPQLDGNRRRRLER